MAYGDFFALNIAGGTIGGVFAVVGDDLMAKEIKVYPAVAFPAKRASQNICIKFSGLFKVGNGEGQMKPGACHNLSF